MHEGTISQTAVRRRRERGATGLEFAGLIVIAAVVAGAIIASIWTAQVGERTCEAVGEIVQSEGAECADAGGPGGGSESPGLLDWLCENWGWFCGSDDDDESGGGDSGYEGDLPDGLDRDHEIVEILNSTERGREMLQWLADNDVEVIFDSSVTGAYYDPALNAIVMGPGYDGVTTFVHEYNHAYYANTGLSVNTYDQATSMSREDWVGGMLDEETASVVLEIVAASEFNDAGHNVTQGQAQRYWDAYDQARQNALDSGLSQAEADAAGRDAGFQVIRQMFVDGTFVTSTTNQTYEDYYGSYWDSVNP